MQIYSQLAPLALGGAHGSAVAMGFFDGIHIGHRAVINGAVEWAKAHGAAPAVFTFRLPTENKMKGKRLLSTEDKHALIASLGVLSCLSQYLINEYLKYLTFLLIHIGKDLIRFFVQIFYFLFVLNHVSLYYS